MRSDYQVPLIWRAQRNAARIKRFTHRELWF
jgi:hypothetical protein